MGFRIGSSIFGSPNPQTSTLGQEIIQQHKPLTWSIPKLIAYRFSFMNSNSSCHIKLNGSTDQIYLALGQGFESDMYDMEIWSFIIVEAGIIYNYVGGY